MRLKQVRRAGMIVLSTCAMAAAVTYTWTDGGSGQRWTTCGNWSSPIMLGCYPGTAADDAIIPKNISVWNIKLTDECIDDLTILSKVHLVPEASDPTTLYVDSLSIVAGQYEVLAELFPSARIVTSDNCPP